MRSEMVRRDEQVGPPARRRRWTRIFWGSALVGSIGFAIWQGVVFLQAPPASVPRPGLDTGARSAPRTGRRHFDGRAAAGRGQPGGASGCIGRGARRASAVDEAPLVARSAGAAEGLRRTPLAVREPGPPGVADRGVRPGLLRGKGFAPVSDATRDGVRRLVFRQGDRTVHVVLRPAKQKPMIRIVVIETRPGGADDFRPSGKEQADG